MSDLTDKIGTPRKAMTLFFVVDASGSMDGSKIGAVNAAIENVIPDLKEISEGNADAQSKVAALEFSSGARWITANGPVEVDQFYWNYMDAGGVTDLGAACKALNEKLSAKAFMREATGSYAPVIFLMSDGDPTDDWQSGLNILKQNNWFKVGLKAAIAIGDEANKEVLKAFTGSMESVLEVHTPAMLKRVIQFVAVTSSQVASRSSNTSNSQTDMGDEQKQQEANRAFQDFNNDPPIVDSDGVIW
jgi:uncharacterized protein YegL